MTCRPPRILPCAGAAVSVTTAAGAYASLQSVPHEIPAALEVTVPEPAPETETDKTGLSAKVAIAFVVPFSVTVQVLVVPTQPPDHPMKAESAAAFAVSTMVAPGS